MRKCLMYDLSPTHFTLINKVQLIELNEKGMYGVWPASLDSSVPAALLVSVTYPHSLNNLNNSKKHLTHSIFFLPLRSQLSSTTLVQTNLLTVFLNGWRFIHSPSLNGKRPSWWCKTLFHFLLLFPKKKKNFLKIWIEPFLHMFCCYLILLVSWDISFF
jgi:hypothetical protein